MDILFPSPVGDLYFSMKIWLILGNLWNSFRPCRGLIFLNQFLSWKVEMILRFRPLSGTYISQYEYGEYFPHAMITFPSPVGDLYFSIMKRFSPSKGFHMVSVPCRGLIFLNKKVYSCQSATLFPSPVGDLYFSITNQKPSKRNLLVSVPCRGLIFLNVEILSNG